MKQSFFISWFVVGAVPLTAFCTGCKTKCTSSTSDAGKTTETCTFEPLVKYQDGNPRTASAPWASMQSIAIRNGNGALTVLADGAGNDVTSSALGFDFEGSSDKQLATDFLNGFANPAVTADATGNVTVDAPGTGGHGYDITVHIPLAFNGPLSVDQGNGPTTVTGAAGTTQVRVVSQNGGVTVSGIGPSLTGTSNVVQTALGSVAMTVPAVSNLTITATASGGTVTVPATWGTNFNMDHSAAGINVGSGGAALTVSTELGNVAFTEQ